MQIQLQVLLHGFIVKHINGFPLVLLLFSYDIFPKVEFIHIPLWEQHIPVLNFFPVDTVACILCFKGSGSFVLHLFAAV